MAQSTLAGNQDAADIGDVPSVIQEGRHDYA